MEYASQHLFVYANECYMREGFKHYLKTRAPHTSNTILKQHKRVGSWIDYELWMRQQQQRHFQHFPRAQIIVTSFCFVFALCYWTQKTFWRLFFVEKIKDLPNLQNNDKYTREIIRHHCSITFNFLFVLSWIV